MCAIIGEKMAKRTDDEKEKNNNIKEKREHYKDKIYRHKMSGVYRILLVVAVVLVLGFIVYHYLYYRQGSKSIYLMKRLPSKHELHKRAIALPMLAILGCLVAALIVMLLYFAIYMLATPKQCLLPNQWQKLWRL